MSTTGRSARDRVRDEAVSVFAERGFAGASLREIARRAQVSPALVVHHFANKDGLRRACDEHVVARLIDDGTGSPGTVDGDLLRRLVESDAVPELDYLARMVMEGGEVADGLVADLCERTRVMLARRREQGLVRPADDEAATAAYVTVVGLAPVLLRRRLPALLPPDESDASARDRFTRAALEIWTHGLYADERLRSAGENALTRAQAGSADQS